MLLVFPGLTNGRRLLQHLLQAVLILFLFQQRAADSDVIRCGEEEKEALLVFRRGLIDRFGTLSSWGSKDKIDCCEWTGVLCLQTGHVYGLQLNFRILGGAPLIGTINASLLHKVHHFRFLDLSYNNFSGCPIPEFLDSVKNLETLSLSHAGFEGPIPHRLGNLSRLQLLDLSGNNGLYNIGNIEWISHLSSLRYLDLSGCDLPGANDWFQVINKLPLLNELRLVWCNLPLITSWNPLKVNATASFLTLDLTGNHVTNSIYPWLFNVSRNLHEFNLNFNLLKGEIPEELGHYMVSLTGLFLKSNELEGGFPKSIGNTSCLHAIDLSSNNMIGQLSGFFQNISGGCTEKKLEFLYLWGNKITGSVPDFTRFSSLKELGLGQNGLNGTISKSIGQMVNLESLDLGDNSLNGVISEDFFLNLSKLDNLDLSHNSLVLELSDDWVPPFKLILSLSLASCKMGPQFPKWIRNLEVSGQFVALLDISNTGISDTIPDWIWDIFETIGYFNISNNHFKGNLPDFSLLDKLPYAQIDMSSNRLGGPLLSLPSGASYINLSGNNFSGPVSFICSADVENLTYLDLSNNQLSGVLPHCWAKFERLLVLNMAHNGLSGKIPPSMGLLHDLLTLRLSNNNFSGDIPTFSNFTRLRILDLQGNVLSGKIPGWIGESLPSLLILSLGSNRLNGNIPLQLCHLANIQILDISLNNISGSIPNCFNNFTTLSEERSSHVAITYEYDNYWYGGVHKYIDSLWLTWKGSKYEYTYTLGLVKSLDLSSNKMSGAVPEEIMKLVGLIALNLSRNNFSGPISPKIGQLKSLDFLDLSRNQFFGEIPSSLSQISGLGVMDLSYNNFSGKIPTGTQLQSFNASVYEGNPGLCGLPLPKECPGEEPAQAPSTKKGKIPEDEFIRLGFYVSLSLGFIAGFWGVCGSLVLCQSWRRAYFKFLGDMKDRMYVTAAINLAKLKQRFNN
ncbi:receptor-like protein EIX2 [Mangifera indica]|uniref:receptor-like protein EIX2 n=1 Tax=Mangifera indica TaxID=29780 RepID=UPI001CFB1CEA|nr:receptor-like protein EIX2 [Mangifera indica]XP_044505284.1 receptor-like protein EIX2 [Mangifera indica]